MRKTTASRKTTETEINLALNADGSGVSKIDTGCGFFDHMLTLFSAHGRFDLDLKCTGDMYVDAHHTVEDCGIALGTAFREALGDCRGIQRYGYFVLPMDEALLLVSLDMSGRSFYSCSPSVPTGKAGDFDTELVDEFFTAFSRTLGLTLHIRILAGKNIHHIIEAIFKCFARALSQAISKDEKNPSDIPSTKGII